MNIITCIFNSSETINNMLKIFLYSARKNEPLHNLIVYHTDLSESVVSEINSKVLNVEFREIALSFDIEKEIASQKMLLWRYAMENAKYGDKNVLMDCDMLFVRPIGDVFNEYNFDFAYTAKDDIKSRCPLNTGIVFFKKNNFTIPFLKKWCDVSHSAVKRGLRSSEINYYGGADQFALCKLIGSPPYLGDREVNGLKIRGLKASEYNVHRHWDKIDNARIIHFKTGWDNILNSEITPYTEALKIQNWHVNKRLKSETWQPSYDIWKKYETEYKER